MNAQRKSLQRPPFRPFPGESGDVILPVGDTHSLHEERLWNGLKSATGKITAPELDSVNRASEMADLFPIPAVDESYVLTEEIKEKSRVIKGVVAGAGYANVLLAGPPGTGKTEFAKQLAARESLYFFTFNCNAVTRADQWWGCREVRGSETVFIPSLLVQAMELGNCVILLDELNRARGENLAALNSLLDNQRRVVIPSVSRPVRVARGTLFVATANFGSQYVGASDLDPALKNRFMYLCLSPLSKSTMVTAVRKKAAVSEQIARTFVEALLTAEKILPGVFSLRNVIRACECVSYGNSTVKAALEMNFLDQFESKTREYAQLKEAFIGAAVFG